MSNQLKNFATPESGVLENDFKQSIEIRVTATEAQRKVQGWVTDVNRKLHAAMPTLVVNPEQIVWRVPAVFSAVAEEVVGTVGTVDVDVRTGLVHTSDKLGEQFMVCARELAAQLPAYQPIQKVPERYIARHAASAHMAQLSEE